MRRIIVGIVLGIVLTLSFQFVTTNTNIPRLVEDVLADLTPQNVAAAVSEIRVTKPCEVRTNLDGGANVRRQPGLWTEVFESLRPGTQIQVFVGEEAHASGRRWLIIDQRFGGDLYISADLVDC